MTHYEISIKRDYYKQGGRLILSRPSFSTEHEMFFCVYKKEQKYFAKRVNLLKIAEFMLKFEPM